MVKMTQDDALKLRAALEPLTHPMVGEEAEEDAGNVIAVASVAISLRRIADAMEKQNKLVESLTNVMKIKR